MHDRALEDRTPHSLYLWVDNEPVPEWADFQQDLGDFTDEVHELARLKGFWERPQPDEAQVVVKLALIMGEVAEALDEVRSQGLEDKEALGEELADVIIRVLDLAGHLNLDLGHHIVTKHNINRTRARKHGKRF